MPGVHGMAATGIGYNVAVRHGAGSTVRSRRRLSAAAAGGASGQVEDKETNVQQVPDELARPSPWLRVATVAFVWGALVGGAHAQRPAQEDLSGFRATPLEIAQLPRYCWASFDPKWTQPGMSEFNLPGGCGERFNHFCPGVLSLQRAKAALADPTRRRYWLGVADGHIHYTVDGIAKLTTCPMQPTVKKLADEIRVLKGAGR